MIGTKPLEEMITLCIYSAYIEDEKGVSAILCARVESGKTSLLAKFLLNSGVVYLTSGTAFGIRKDYLADFYHGRKRVLIIPDLIVPLNQSKDTVALFIGFLNAFIEEGVKEIKTYKTHFSMPRPVSGSLITAISKEDLDIRQNRWAAMGFMSRLLPVSFSYSPDMQIRVHESITRREYHHEAPIFLNCPQTPQKILLPPKLGRKADKLSRALISKFKGQELYGFRFHRQLQRLMLANALRQGRGIVKPEDYDLIEDISQYFNLDYKELG